MKKQHEQPHHLHPTALPERFEDWFISDETFRYMEEHELYELQEEYKARYGEWYPRLMEHGGSVEEYMADLRAVFDGEDIEAIIKKHQRPEPEPMSIEDILELLKHQKDVE